MVEDGRLDDRLLLAPPRRILGKKAVGDAVVAGRRQVDAQRSALGGEVGVRQLQKNARPVASARIASGGASMGEVGENLQGLVDHLTAGDAI